jgi:putative membrane protein
MTLGWQVDPVLIGGLLTFAVLYGLLTGPLRGRLAPGAAYPRRQAVYFYGALAVFYLAEGSPLHDLAEIYLFSAHMVQHLLLSYVVALLFIVGTPVWILRPLLLNRVAKPVAKVLTRPVVAAVVFSLFFSGWHFPAVYEGALGSDIVHHSEHIIFIGTALLMWWPLLSPLPELPRLSNVGQILYLFALPFGQFLVAALLTFSSQVIYPTYAAAPRLLGMSALSDQQLGGAIMKFGGFIVYGIPLVLAFFRWYRIENSSVARPPAKRRGATNQVGGTEK